jgi:hypothetical protein
MPLGTLFTPEEAQTEFIQSFIRAVDTLENVSQSIDRLADRQRVEVDSSRILYHGRFTTTADRIYTTPQGTVTEVREIVVTNTSTQEATFNLAVVPPNMVYGTEHIQYDSVKVRGKETLEATRKLALESDWKIFIKSNRNNVLNIHISGVELVTA